MTLQPFFASTAGDPASLVRMIAFQTADTVPALDSKLVPYKSFGGALTPQPTTIPRQAVLTRPMRDRAMQSKVDNAGRSLSLGDIDPSNEAQLINMLSLFQGYSLATANGHTRWRISQQMAIDGTQILNKWTHMNDSNKGIPFRHVDCLTRSMALTLQPRANASLVCGVEAGRFDFWEVPAVTGTGAVLPILRGTTSGNWTADATDSDVYIQITSDSATAVVFKAKVASAGSYSADQTATKGTWTYVYTGASSSVPLGGRAAQVEVYFPAGADGQFVDADVWLFENRRDLGVVDGDYTDPTPLAETQFRFLLNGESIYVDNGVTINVDVPGAVTRYAAGGEQAIGTDRKGQHDITVSLDRRLVDLELQQALMTADTVSLVAEGRNDTLAGTSAYYFGAAFVMPYLTIEGPMHDAEVGAQNFNEVLTLRAFKPLSSFTYGGFSDIDADLEIIWDTELIAADLGL